MSTPLEEFWNAMHEGGAVIVDAPDEKRETDSAALERAIIAVELHWRLELAYDPPRVAMPAAVWATTLMYRASQFLVYREVDAKTVQLALKQPCPLAPSPEVCYSTDLALRVLPLLLALARGVALDDPLVIGLNKLAQDWPLSSVGVPEVTNVDVSTFIDHPTLRRLYADRIIERRDASRLIDPRVVAAVREALGAHASELAPTLLPSISEAM